MLMRYSHATQATPELVTLAPVSLEINSPHAHFVATVPDSNPGEHLLTENRRMVRHVLHMEGSLGSNPRALPSPVQPGHNKRIHCELHNPTQSKSCQMLATVRVA